jgi:hypothetical protein
MQWNWSSKKNYLKLRFVSAVPSFFILFKQYIEFNSVLSNWIVGTTFFLFLYSVAYVILKHYKKEEGKMLAPSVEVTPFFR